MKNVLILIISFASVAYARASEFLVARIEKDKFQLLDENSLKLISGMQENGIIEVQEQHGQAIVLTTLKGSEGQSLFEGLRQKGIVYQRETSAGSDCVGFCVKP